MALPFRFIRAPLEFTMVAEEVKLMALAEGISIHQYINYWLMRAGQNNNAKTIQRGCFILSKAWVGS